MASAKIQRMSKSSKQNPSEDRSSRPSHVPGEIQCKICRKRYEDPKLLPCLHTFCKQCLEKSLEKHGGVLYCPVCPGEIRLSNFTGVDKLPNNFLVSNLLQAIDLKQGVASKQCDSCDERAEASSRCFECSDFLCDNCVEAHRRVRFTKQHRVASLKNLDAEALLRTPCCSSHVQEAVKMFCKQCKELVCRSCIVNEHDNHVLVSLKEAVEDAKPKLNTLLVTTRAKIPILQRKLKEVHSSQEKLETKVDDVIKDIQATSARILMAVKRREKDLYRMLRRIHDKKSDELESRQVALQNELAQVLDSCEFTDELVKQGNDAMVLNMSGTAYARLKFLGEKDIAPVLEIHEDEIEYTVDDKPILEELKIYGKVMSRDDKAKKAEKAKEESKQRKGMEKEGKKIENEKKQEAKKEVAKKEDENKPTVERKVSWLETLANPRVLLRRLSFGGDESDGRRPGAQSTSKDHDGIQKTSKDERDAGTKTESPKQHKVVKQPSQEKIKDKDNQVETGQRKRANSVSENRESTRTSNNDNQTTEQSSSPSTARLEKPQVTEADNKTHPPTTHDTPKDPKDTTTSQLPSEPTEPNAVYQTPHSILKQPQANKAGTSAEVLPSSSSQAWTFPKGSRPSGANSLSYLPALNILTKNRRGRPREVEVQLESPDNSIVSAQILDHKDGTYTIFYCPLTPGEHNLYVNIGGKNIKHGKKVLNFYGKFGGMGAEELYITRRALSCIRWQVTPGFVEIKGKKLTANPDI